MTLEESLKRRLAQVAKERHLTPAVVWQNVIADRFLARLCVSPYKLNFVLKGGNLLAKYFDLGRATQDLDFAIAALKSTPPELLHVLEEIAKIDIQDGFTFRNVKLEMLSPFHVNFPGAQVRIDALFGKVQNSLFIDLGFGDHVAVLEDNIRLLSSSKGPLFEPHINLACAPLEFVFAEKLETAVFRGSQNSRMKDFHDLLTLITTPSVLDKAKTHLAIKVIFEHRGTPLKLPLQLDEEALQEPWRRYWASSFLQEQLPIEIGHVIKRINFWLQ